MLLFPLLHRRLFPCYVRHFTVPANFKLPINSLQPISPQDVALVGEEALETMLTLPPRNETEQNFNNSIKFYLDTRNILLARYPEMEGKWLLTSSSKKELAVFSTELLAHMFQKSFHLNDSYYDCLGREVLEQSFEEDEAEDSVEEGLNQSYPSVDSQNILWNNSLWIPGQWKSDEFDSEWSDPIMMKFDSGAVNVGVPSKIVFQEGKYSVGKPKYFYGISGKSLKRRARNVSIKYNNSVVSIASVFEYNKFLLGYSWFQHFEININSKKKPPLTVREILDK